MTLASDVDEARVSLERLRKLLENLTVRGLRACGPDELSQLDSNIEYLDGAGAGHVASVLTALRDQIANDRRTAAKALLEAQMSVRLLERLLTLRVVRSQYKLALEVSEAAAAAACAGDVGAGDDEG